MDKKFNGVKQNENVETQGNFAKKNFAKIGLSAAILAVAGGLLVGCSNEKSAKNSADNAPKTAQSAKNAESSSSTPESSDSENGLKISFSEFKSEINSAGYTINSAEITEDSLGKAYYATVTLPDGKTGYILTDKSGMWGINGESSNVLLAAKDAGFLFD